MVVTCARLSTEQELVKPSSARSFHDFALTAIVKAALTEANEYRGSGVTPQDVLEMQSAHIAVHDSFVENGDYVSFFARIAFEQFGYNVPFYWDVTRTHAFFRLRPKSPAKH